MPGRHRAFDLHVDGAPKGPATAARPHTVFVLGGGGNLGAVQVGMLHALVEAGFTPDAIVGTSIGALNGAFFAGHGDLAGVEALRELWLTVRRQDVFPTNMRSIARGLFHSQNHLFGAEALRALVLRADIGFSRLEQAPIALHVVATDLCRVEVAMLSTGDAVTALLASAAIPGLFPPVEIEGRTLVDGGVLANLPVAEAEELDPSVVFVLPATVDRTFCDPSNAIVMLQRAVAMAGLPDQRRALEEAGGRRRVTVLPVPEEAASLSLFDFKETERLIDDTRLLSARLLGEGGSARGPGLGEAAPSP